tara:strand:- start:4727 stop:5116 length:390 start_codon:yes stop_codon:yes gene_type:complete
MKNISNHIESEYANFWIDGEIIFVVYKKGVVIDQKVAIKIVEDRLSLQQGKPFLVFCDASGIKSIDKAARNYLAIEGSILITATALLVNNPITNVMSDFYLKTSSHPCPIQAFTEKKEAMAFLKTHTSK